MLLDATTDTIEVKLGGSVTTRQPQFYASYNTVTSTVITPAKNFGSTNNTTAVTVMPAPSASQQNQLRYCSIYNCDTFGQTVTIQLNNNSTIRVLFTAYLFVGEYIQYTPTNGWRAYNHNGIMKTFATAVNPTSVRMPPFFNAINGTTNLTLSNGTTYAFYLGQADRPYDQVSILTTLATAYVGLSFQEAAIYKGYPTMGANLTLTRCGWLDVSVGNNIGFNATGTKNIPINTSGITAGDEIWAVLASSATTTAPIIRSGLVDDIGSGIVQTNTSNLRPSTSSSIAFTLQSATNMGWISWQGFQR